MITRFKNSKELLKENLEDTLSEALVVEEIYPKRPIPNIIKRLKECIELLNRDIND